MINSKNSTLEASRKKINKLDKKIARLFEQRMSVAAEIAKIKKTENLPIFDKSREEEICEREVEYIKNPKLKPFYLEFIKSLMEISKKWQNTFLLEKN